MPVGVVEGFEIVDIDHDQGNGVALPEGFLDLKVQKFLEIAVIVEARQPIDDGRVQGFFIMGPQLVELGFLFKQDFSPGLEFPADNRLDQEIIGLEFEALNPAVHVFQAGDDDDRQVLAFVRALDPAADLKSVQAGQKDVQEHHIHFPCLAQFDRILSVR